MVWRKHPRWLLLGAAVLVTAVLSSCASTGGARHGRQGYTERGYASWYGPGFHGRATASGEIYDMHDLTAAHKELPLGTVVEVRNLENGRRVQVRINDRGPFVRGRIIDLSHAGAQKIGMIGPGTAKVEIQVVRTAAVGNDGSRFVVQAGAFQSLDEARDLSQLLEAEFPDVRVTSDGVWHRVQLGPFKSRKQADQIRKKLGRQGFPAFVRRTT